MIAVRSLALAAATSVLLAGTAKAHFVWVVVTAENGSPRAEMYFSEEAAPGSAELVDRMDPAKAWVAAPGQDLRALELSSWANSDEEVGGLAAPLNGSSTCRVEVDCQYGVFTRGERSMLLHYYAKTLMGVEANQLASFGRAKKLALDIVPEISGQELVLKVLWQGSPVADCAVIVEGAADDSLEVKTDESGKVRVPLPTEDGYAVRATHAIASGGELDGKSYASEMHIATLTFSRPTSNNPDVAAIDLLNAARASRAVWEDFPGFSAKFTVNVDDQQEEGTIVVSEDGDATLTGFDKLGGGFVKQQIDSLLMHRMPGSAFEVGADYEHEMASHVLGQRVRLEEERMGSVYRIRDNVITEVNRIMGKQRFTISVLDVQHNEEGKYLPHVFTVSFWDNESGALKSNHTYFHEWQRVRGYDLPVKLIIVSSDESGRQVTQFGFSDHQLLSTQQAAVGRK